MLHSAESSRYVNYITVHDSLLTVGTQEATTKVVTVQGFDISTVKGLVSFLYEGDYDVNLPTENTHAEDTVITDANDDGWGTTTSESNDQAGSKAKTAAAEKKKADVIQVLLFHLEVNAIADYYDIQGLRDLAESKIKKILLGSNTTLPRLLQEASSGAHANLYAIIAEVAAESHDISGLFSQDDTPLKLDPALYSKIIVACGL